MSRPRKTAALPVADEKSDGDAESQPWYAGGLRFSCTCCGNCCTGPPGYVWITDDEIDRLAAHLKQPADEVRRLHVRTINGRQSLRERRNAQGEYDCVFLKPLPGDRPGRHGRGGVRKRGCSVYAARPLQCRTWPFWGGLLQSREAWDHSKQTCPGLDRPTGRVFGVKEIERLRDAEDWPDAPPSSGE